MSLQTVSFQDGSQSSCTGKPTLLIILSPAPLLPLLSSETGHVLYSLEETGPSEYTPCTYEYTEKKVEYPLLAVS